MNAANEFYIEISGEFLILKHVPCGQSVIDGRDRIFLGYANQVAMSHKCDMNPSARRRVG
jgi:hypothetical protein